MDWYVQDAPTSVPYACVFCGSHKGPVVHANVDRPGIGLVYVCVKCANGIALEFGYAEPGSLEEAALEIKKLSAELAEHEGELAELRPVREAIASAAARFEDAA